MQEEDETMQAVAESLGRIWLALARAVGDLTLALAEQPGVDGEKLLRDFIGRLPKDQDDGISKVFDAIRQYLDREGASTRE